MELGNKEDLLEIGKKAMVEVERFRRNLRKRLKPEKKSPRLPECQQGRSVWQSKREIVAGQAKERFGGRHKDETTVANLPQLSEGKTRDSIAAEIGVSEKLPLVFLTRS